MYLGPGVMYVVNLIILLIITSIYMFMTDLQMTLWTLIPLPILSYGIYKVSDIINKKSIARNLRLRAILITIVPEYNSPNH